MPCRHLPCIHIFSWYSLLNILIQLLKNIKHSAKHADLISKFRANQFRFPIYTTLESKLKISIALENFIIPLQCNKNNHHTFNCIQLLSEASFCITHTFQVTQFHPENGDLAALCADVDVWKFAIYNLGLTATCP